MQRKTKFKIIFYSIGFISIALLPYVFTKQDAEQNQRYAQLPSYNNVDTAHPFLSRLKRAGSSLADLLRSNNADPKQQAEPISDASVEALKQAAEKEVLASLAPKQNTANTLKATAAAIAPATEGVAPAPLPEEPSLTEGENLPAEELKNQAVSTRTGQTAPNFTPKYAPSNELNQKGYIPSSALLNNNVYARSKNGALENLIAQGDAQLARTLWNNTHNPSKTARKKGKSSSQKGSFKVQFQKAKNALKQAAVARAKAKQYSYGYAGTTAAAVPVTNAQVQYEMMLQNQELNSIFAQQAAAENEQEKRENPNDSQNQLQHLILYDLTSTGDGTETFESQAKLKPTEKNLYSPIIPIEDINSQKETGDIPQLLFDDEQKEIVVVLDVAQKNQNGLDFFAPTQQILEQAEQKEIGKNSPEARTLAEKIKTRKEELNLYNDEFTKADYSDSDPYYYVATPHSKMAPLKDVAVKAGYVFSDNTNTQESEQPWGLTHASDLNKMLSKNQPNDDMQDDAPITYIYPTTKRLYEHLMKNLDTNQELFYFVIKPEIDYDQLKTDAELANSMQAIQNREEVIEAMEAKGEGDSLSTQAMQVSLEVGNKYQNTPK